MSSLTIKVKDAKFSAILDCYCRCFGYEDKILETDKSGNSSLVDNPESKLDFATRLLTSTFVHPFLCEVERKASDAAKLEAMKSI